MVGLLDAAVDRATYRLGPGDQLNLALLGDFNRVETLSVTPEGTVLVPGIGVARVLGLTLDEAEERVRREVLRLYRNVQVRLALAELRTFKVYLLGAVAEPGMRVASPAMRVSDLLGGDRPDSAVVRRNLTLRRGTGAPILVDLLPFLYGGDLSANPTLREGDVVFVPPVDRTVQVVGRVAFPGRYEYRDGETLAEFLELVNGRGSFPADAADTIRVNRPGRDGRNEVHAIARADAVGAAGREFQLRPFDAVLVPSIGNFVRQYVATIGGRVVRPGTYPIEPGVTTVRDLVELGGGFLPDASLANAVLRRRADGVPTAQSPFVPVEVMTQEERQVQQVRARGDHTNVVIDMERLFAGAPNALDQALQPGDSLIVPRRRAEVVVLGAVANPGIVDFAPGMDLQHYVRLAGGMSSRADRRNVTVLKSKLGTEVAARDVSVLEPGDQIVVPFRAQRSWRQNMDVVNAVLGTVSGVILTVIALRGL